MLIWEIGPLAWGLQGGNLRAARMELHTPGTRQMPASELGSASSMLSFHFGSSVRLEAESGGLGILVSTDLTPLLHGKETKALRKAGPTQGHRMGISDGAEIPSPAFPLPPPCGA